MATSDRNDFEDQMQDLDGMELMDRKTIVANSFGLDITEVYLPERAAKAAKRYGLFAGSSMDITRGFDFTKESGRQLAWRRVKEEAPFVLIGSPPCTYFCMLQELNIATNKHKPGWMENFEAEREKAKQHVTFCCSLYRYQIDQGKHFEHPCWLWGCDILTGYLCCIKLLSFVSHTRAQVSEAAVNRRI